MILYHKAKIKHFKTKKVEFYGFSHRFSARKARDFAARAISGVESEAFDSAGAHITRIKITDENNMGAAMAPAASDTIARFLKGTNTTAKDYNLILTGDFGAIGSSLLKLPKERNSRKHEKNNQEHKTAKHSNITFKCFWHFKHYFCSG